MGTIRKGANGGFSGKAGSVVGSNWKDIDYIKGLSKKRTGSASQLQIESQAKFATAIRFLKPIKDLLNYTYASLRTGRAMGFNMALKHVMKSGIIGNYPNYAIDYAAVTLSVGSLALATGSVNAEPGGIVKFNWDPEPNDHNGYNDDKMTVLIYDPVTNIYKNGLAGKTRADGGSEITLRPEMLGRSLKVYYFLTSRDGKKLSPSWFAGEIVVI